MTNITNEKLEKLIRLAQHQLAIQLYLNGVPQGVIAKQLGLATKTVNDMLKGLKKKS